jgi:hypothetical protein
MKTFSSSSFYGNDAVGGWKQVVSRLKRGHARLFAIKIGRYQLPTF